MNYKYLVTLTLLLSCVNSCATPPTNSSLETAGVADAKAKEAAAEQKAKLETEAKAKEEAAAEQKAKLETEAKAKEEAAEQKAKLETEAKAKEEAAEQKAKLETEAKAKEAKTANINDSPEIAKNPKYSPKSKPFSAKKDGYYTDIEFDDDTRYTGYLKNGVRHGSGFLYKKLTKEYYLVRYENGILIYKSFFKRE